MRKFLIYTMAFIFIFSLLVGCAKFSDRQLLQNENNIGTDSGKAEGNILIQKNDKVISGSAFMLDTNCMISIYDQNPDLNKKQILEQAFTLIKKLENQLSWKIADSEISQINNRVKSSLSDEALTLIEKALQFSEQTNGAFDITVGRLTDLWDFSSAGQIVPEDREIKNALQSVGYQNIEIKNREIHFKDARTKLDLGAVAKGYIADQVKLLLSSQKVENAIINLGGNVLCLGEKKPGQGFLVGIQNPFHEGYLLTVEATEKYPSVIASGIYERYFEKDGKFYHHILNTDTGYPVQNDLLSVTILSQFGLDGDILSTTCFILGLQAGLKFINKMENIHAVFIDKNYQVYYSENLTRDLKIEKIKP